MDIANDRLFTLEEAAEALRISLAQFKKVKIEHPDIFVAVLSGGRKCHTASQLNRYLEKVNPHLANESQPGDIAAAASQALSQAAIR